MAYYLFNEGLVSASDEGLADVLSYWDRALVLQVWKTFDSVRGCVLGCPWGGGVFSTVHAACVHQFSVASCHTSCNINM